MLPNETRRQGATTATTPTRALEWGEPLAREWGQGAKSCVCYRLAQLRRALMPAQCDRRSLSCSLRCCVISLSCSAVARESSEGTGLSSWLRHVVHNTMQIHVMPIGITLDVEPTNTILQVKQKI